MESSEGSPPKFRLLSDCSINTLSEPETRGLGLLRSVLSEAEKCELSAPEWSGFQTTTRGERIADGRAYHSHESP